VRLGDIGYDRVVYVMLKSKLGLALLIPKQSSPTQIVSFYVTYSFWRVCVGKYAEI
jgi:hypothetical protein